MALETMKGVKEVNGVEVVDINAEREAYERVHSAPAQRQDGIKFNAETWDQFFERVIRPSRFIFVRQDKNSISFNIQNGPIGEVGKNGCQVEDMVAVAKYIVEQLNAKFPCPENVEMIHHLGQAIQYSKLRTSNRQNRGVEGKSEI